MANLNFDLDRLLTGVSSRPMEVQEQPIPGSPNFRGEFGAQIANELQAGLGKLVRGGRPTQAQQLRQVETNLDLNTIEGLTTLAKIQQARQDNEGLAQTATKIEKLKEKEADTKQRTSLIKMAREQDNPNMATWLEVGGDPKTAASVLLKQPKLATPEAYASMFTDKGEVVRTAVIGGKLSRATEDGWATVKDAEKLYATNPKKKEDGAKASNLTKSNIEDYDAIIAQNPAVKKALEVEGWFMGKQEDAKKRVLLIKAEQIYTNNPKLGREGALLQAAKIEKAQEANVSSDPDSNVTAN
tara:strand:- start:1085 stop:1981 length:897 start_codon:yes stop_codon:yes gene_type:complete